MATKVLGLHTFTAPEPWDFNIVNDNSLKIDNGVKTAMQGRAPHNWLDNSWFVNPVNQRGQTSYTGAGYTIDRWKAGVSECSMNVNAGESVAFNTKTEGVNAYWRQYLPHSLSQLGGKTFTLAIKDTWGKTHCATGVYPSSAPSDLKSVIWLNMYDNVSIVLYCANDGTALVQLTTKTPVAIVWVALYEGSYTADTLPAYQPKGYAAELAECRRYYKKYSTCQFPITITSASWAAVAIDYTDMRGTPTITYDLAGLYVADNVYTSITSITARTLPASELVINTGVSVAANKTGTIRFNSLALSYDL